MSSNKGSGTCFASPSSRRHLGTWSLSNRASWPGWSRAELLYRLTAGLRYRYPADLRAVGCQASFSPQDLACPPRPKESTLPRLLCVALCGERGNARASRVWLPDAVAPASHSSNQLDVQVHRPLRKVLVRISARHRSAGQGGISSLLAAIMLTSAAERDGCQALLFRGGGVEPLTKLQMIDRYLDLLPEKTMYLAWKRIGDLVNALCTRETSCHKSISHAPSGTMVNRATSTRLAGKKHLAPQYHPNCQRQHRKSWAEEKGRGPNRQWAVSAAEPTTGHALVIQYCYYREGTWMTVPRRRRLWWQRLDRICRWRNDAEAGG